MVVLASTGYIVIGRQQLDAGGKRAALRTSPTDHCRNFNGYRDCRAGGSYGAWLFEKSARLNL